MAIPEARFSIKAIDRTKKAFASITKGMQKIGGQIAKFGGIAAGVGAAGLGVLVKNAAGFVEETTSMASVLGVGTDELAELGFAAQAMGIPMKAATTAFQRFRRRAQEAGRGGGELKKVVQAMGVDAKVFAGLPLPQQVRMFADAMNAGKFAGWELSAAMKAFDVEGVRMLEVLRKGTPFLDRMAIAAREAGVSFGPELAGKVDRFVMALGQIKGLFLGLGIDIIEKTIDRATNALELFKQQWPEIKALAIDFVTNLWNWMKFWWQWFMTNVWPRIQQVGEVLKLAVQGAGKLFEFGDKAAPLIGEAAMDVTKGFQTAGEFAGRTAFGAVQETKEAIGWLKRIAFGVEESGELVLGP